MFSIIQWTFDDLNETLPFKPRVQIRGAKVIEDKGHLFVHYDNFDTNIFVTL